MPRMLFAGFGGQGILFMGKVVVNAGLLDGREVTWLPSYGPEMRGGTCNCSVCVEDEPIGCPIVNDPQYLIPMNQPSYDKFLKDVQPEGIVVYDSSLVEHTVARPDVVQYGAPATAMATEHRLFGLANIILLGRLLQVTKFADLAHVKEALTNRIPASRAELAEKNQQALMLGYEL